LTDQEWTRLAPLLPNSQGKRGHPYKEHRRVIDGIRWRARTGAPWRDIPERYGPWQTCYDRFLRWQQRGIWVKILQALQGAADAAGELVWTHCSIDGSVVRAHQHAAGARHAPATAPGATAVQRVPGSAPSEPATPPAADGAAASAAEKRGPRRSLGKPSVGAGAGSRRSCTSPSTGGGGRWGSI